MAIALVVSSCGDDHDPDEHSDPSAFACETIEKSAPSLTATTERQDAPTLAVGAHARVTLPAGEASFVRLDSSGELLLFADVANVVTALFAGDDPSNVLPAGSPNEDCPAVITDHFDLDLSGAGPWYVRLGPAAVPEIWLMLVSAEGHGAH